MSSTSGYTQGGFSRTLDGLQVLEADEIIIDGQTVVLGNLFDKVTDDSDDILQGVSNLFVTPAEKALFHAPVTIGIGNGLGLYGVTGQELSLNVATTTTNGAMTATHVNTLNSAVQTVTAPLIKSGINIYMTQANSGTNGWLSGGDWNWFNNKQNQIMANYPVWRSGDTIGMYNVQPWQDGYLTANQYNSLNSRISAGSYPLWTSGTTMYVYYAGSFQDGVLSSYWFNQFNNKQNQIGAAWPLYRSGDTVGIYQSSSTQAGYLSSTDWNTFNGKQDAITGGASTITSANLTASRALVSDASGKVAVSATTSTELGYLTGLTGNVQAQIDAIGFSPWEEIVGPSGSVVKTYTQPATVEITDRLKVVGDGTFTGRVGIGSTTVPSSWQLEVTGGIRATAQIRGEVDIVSAGRMGVGTYTPSSTALLDVGSKIGNTVAVLGDFMPVYVVADGPHVCFNQYYNGGWKRGRGYNGQARYGGNISYDTGGGTMSFNLSTNAPNNEGDNMTNDTTLSLNRFGNAFVRGDIFTQNGGISIDEKISRTAMAMLANWTLTCRYRVTYQNNSVRWFGRIIAIPVKRSTIAGDGYFDINCPTSGTITYYRSDNVTTTVTCTSWGIPIPSGWCALFYEVSDGQGQASDQSRFRLCDYPNSSWTPNRNWICIFSTNDDGAGTLYTTIPKYIRWNPNMRDIGYGQDLWGHFDRALNGSSSDVLYGTPLWAYYPYKNGGYPNAQPSRIYAGGSYDDGSYFYNRWNSRFMFALYGAQYSGQTGVNIIQCMALDLDVWADVHNTLCIEGITGDRWTGMHAYVVFRNYVNLGTTDYYPLGASVNSVNVSGVTSGMATRPSPNNSSAIEVRMHEWLTWCIPAATIRQWGYDYYDNGRRCKLRIILHNAQNCANPSWLSGVCVVPNPYGFSFVNGLGMHWAMNAPYGYSDGFSWYGDWNSESMCQQTPNTAQTTCLKTPWNSSDEATDIYLGYVLHGATWFDNAAMIGWGGTYRQPGCATRSRFGKMMNSKQTYRSCFEIFVPRNEVQAMLTYRNGTAFLNFTIYNQDDGTNIYIRGCYMEIACDTMAY